MRALLLSAIIPVGNFLLQLAWQEVVERLVYQRRCNVGGFQRRYGMAKLAWAHKFRIRVFDRVLSTEHGTYRSIQSISDKTPASGPKTYIGMDNQDNSSSIECRDCYRCHEKQPITEFVNPRNPAVPTVACQRCRSKLRELKQQSSRFVPGLRMLPELTKILF